MCFVASSQVSVGLVASSYSIVLSSIGGSSTIPASSGFVASTFVSSILSSIIGFGQVSCSLVPCSLVSCSLVPSFSCNLEPSCVCPSAVYACVVFLVL
jgi:hypothetical protein